MLEQALLLIGPLMGLFFGFLLAKIVPEELADGKRYFILLRRALFSMTVIISFFLLIQNVDDIFLIILFIAAIIQIALDIKFPQYWIGLGGYIPLLFAQLIYPGEIFQLLLAGLIFLYGLPTGTMWGSGKR